MLPPSCSAPRGECSAETCRLEQRGSGPSWDGSGHLGGSLRTAGRQTDRGRQGSRESQAHVHGGTLGHRAPLGCLSAAGAPELPQQDSCLTLHPELQHPVCGTFSWLVSALGPQDRTGVGGGAARPSFPERKAQPQPYWASEWGPLHVPPLGSPPARPQPPPLQFPGCHSGGHPALQVTDLVFSATCCLVSSKRLKLPPCTQLCLKKPWAVTQLSSLGAASGDT